VPVLDVVLLHRNDPEQPVDVFVNALAQLADGGLARQVGLSNWAAPRCNSCPATALAWPPAGTELPVQPSCADAGHWAG
jgi:aryl-alcohol dehydrogenase-like predicted oxidoreductase